MWDKFPLFPESASTIAEGVDSLYFFLIGVAALFTVLIFSVTFYFAVRYRRRPGNENPAAIEGNAALEVFWSVVPFVVGMIIFGWGANLYFKNAAPPPDAMDIHVVGKQWMWKLQHPKGRREINELHVPIGQPVRLIMTSEDVIHSFYVPAFRIKMDVLPGRYTTAWFEATKAGEYHLFCAEYCGNEHSKMGGTVYVMAPDDYERWLSATQEGEAMSSVGERLFSELRCDGCHRVDNTGRGPSLVGRYGTMTHLNTGLEVLADEAYLRQSILQPGAKVVAGFQPVMPTFQGQVTEEQVMEIIAYLETLAVNGNSAKGASD